MAGFSPIAVWNRSIALSRGMLHRYGRLSVKGKVSCIIHHKRPHLTASIDCTMVCVAPWYEFCPTDVPL